jgi:hypothetical protein
MLYRQNTNRNKCEWRKMTHLRVQKCSCVIHYAPESPSFGVLDEFVMFSLTRRSCMQCFIILCHVFGWQCGKGCRNSYIMLHFSTLRTRVTHIWGDRYYFIISADKSDPNATFKSHKSYIRHLWGDSNYQN